MADHAVTFVRTVNAQLHGGWDELYRAGDEYFVAHYELEEATDEHDRRFRCRVWRANSDGRKMSGDVIHAFDWSPSTNVEEEIARALPAG